MKSENIRSPYIPEKFFNHVSSSIRIHEDYLSKSEPKVNLFHRVWMDKTSYLTNLISENSGLEDFYRHNGDNTELLNRIYCLFDYLPEWSADFKTSGNHDSAIIKKLGTHLSKCAALLFDSPDVRFNLQIHWEQYLRDMIDDACKKDMTDKGMEIKRLAKKLLYPSILNRNELIEKGVIKETNSYEFSTYVDLQNLFRHLSNFLYDVAPLAKEKSGVVKKLNAEDACIHYAVRNLKELFVKHGVNSRKHVKYINDLINGVMKENINEDRIRKLIG